MIKPTETEKVDSYMQKFEHPLKDVLQALREAILESGKEIGEEIKWNAPTFFYTGEMPESDPKLFKRYLIVSMVKRQDEILLVWPHGDKVDNGSGFLSGDYKDGRRLLSFKSMTDVETKKAEMQKLLKELVSLL